MFEATTEAATRTVKHDRRQDQHGTPGQHDEREQHRNGEDHDHVQRLVPVQPVQEQEIERVGERVGHDQRVPGDEEHEAEHRKGREGGADESARSTAGEPKREDEEEERRQGREIAAQKMRGIARSEEADLQNDHPDRGDADRNQRARSRVALLPAKRADGQEQERGERHEPGRERRVGEVLEAESQRRPERIRPTQDTGVRAGERRDCRKRNRCDSEQHPGRPERAQTRSLARQRGVEQDRTGEHRHEHDRLRPCQHGDQDRGERNRLGAERRGRDGASDGEQCERRDRVEEHLGHHEARIEKERRGDRECRGEQGITGRHQPAPEEEHRHRRERHDERL